MTRKTRRAIWAAILLFVSWGIQNIWYVDTDAKLTRLNDAKARAYALVDPFTPIDYIKLFGPDSSITAAQLADRRLFARSLAAMAEPIKDIPGVSVPAVALYWWGNGQESPWGKTVSMPGDAIVAINEHFATEYARTSCLRDLLRWSYIVLYALAAVLGIIATGMPTEDPPKRKPATVPAFRQDDGLAE